jgi:hypothetical protein
MVDISSAGPMHRETNHTQKALRDLKGLIIGPVAEGFEAMAAEGMWLLVVDLP